MNTSQYQLYEFDSCPYCTRVRALLGLKKLSIAQEYPAAGSLPEALSGHIDRLQVPMLVEYPRDATQDAPCSVLTESEAIMQYLDGLDGEPLMTGYREGSALQQWLVSNRARINALVYPRMPALQLPELASESARAYFLGSRPQSMGRSFQSASQQTGILAQDMNQAFYSLETLLDLGSFLHSRRPLNIDDLIVFSELRTLSMVAELTWPRLLWQAVDAISQRSGVSLYRPVDAARAAEAL